jgi:hypothetical protein
MISADWQRVLIAVLYRNHLLTQHLGHVFGQPKADVEYELEQLTQAFD